MGFDIEKWYTQKMQGEVLLRYMGEISSEKITEALGEIELSLNLKKEKNKVRKKVYNVFVESIQNLFHHVDIPPATAKVQNIPRFGVIILARDRSFYRISTGNFVQAERVQILRDRIDQVNSLSDEELRTVYRDILGNEGASLKGGGGLGILDIVRKTGNKLEYAMYPHDEDFVFFAMDVYIS